MSKKTLLGLKIGSVHAEKFLVGYTIWSCLAKKVLIWVQYRVSSDQVLINGLFCTPNAVDTKWS